VFLHHVLDQVGQQARIASADNHGEQPHLFLEPVKFQHLIQQIQLRQNLFLPKFQGSFARPPPISGIAYRAGKLLPDNQKLYTQGYFDFSFSVSKCDTAYISNRPQHGFGGNLQHSPGDPDTNAPASAESKPAQAWLNGVFFLLTSPVTALPVTFVLMLAVGDEVLPVAETEYADSGLLLLALKRAVAALYIALLLASERLLICGAAMITCSVAFVLLAKRLPGLGRRLVLAMLLSGLLYPAIWVASEFFGWNGHLFN